MEDASAESRRDALLRFLAEHDEPCPSCGYNLRGLTGETCPECRQELVLRVNLAEPRMGGLLFAATGLLAGVGGSLAFVGVAIFLLFYFVGAGGVRTSEMAVAFGIPALCLFTNGLLTVRLLRATGRRWFRERGRPARLLVAGLCWLWSAAFVVVFVVLAVQ